MLLFSNQSVVRRFIYGVFVAVISPVVFAQNLDEVRTNSLTAMSAKEWSEAHAILSKTVQQFNGRDVLFGSKFGWFWYHKGYCELKLRKWREAMASFETCYKKFPNLGDGAQAGGNFYHKQALLKWGDACLGAGDYKTAIRMYKKFLAERDPKRDRYDQENFHIKMARCHFKIGQIPEGVENLEMAIQLPKQPVR